MSRSVGMSRGKTRPAIDVISDCRDTPKLALERVFSALHARYDDQHWWPADGPFEVMLGAILTQNTSWSNVERALSAVRASHPLQPDVLLSLPEGELATLLRPVGYFNLKARRLRIFCRAYLDAGGFVRLCRMDTEPLRAWLLELSGIGPETADDILLYAFERPVFVVDAYTRRVFEPLGCLSGDESYEEVGQLFERALESNVPLLNEYHALIVRHGKQVCRKRPICTGCCLRFLCGRKVG